MKRVIDIENDYYEIIKYNVGNGYDYKPLVIIANSMPYEEKPQGEWIEIKKGIDSNTYKCPFCERLINCDKPRLKLYPFCHCGADLRGAENNGK